MNDNDNHNNDDEKLSKRFYLLNTCAAIILLAAIFVSISQFGETAWRTNNKIALILPGEREKVGWDSIHYKALTAVCKDSDNELTIKENILPDYDECDEVVRELSKAGVVMINFANGIPLSDLKKFEVKYPRVSFYTIENISALNSSGRYIILSFEGSYLAGILAGLRTKTGKVGYIAPFSGPEINLEINAFTLGVQRVNPDAEILLNRTGSWDNAANEERAVQILRANDVDILIFRQNGDFIPNAAERTGIKFISYNGSYPTYDKYLASIKIDWTAVYTDLIKYEKTGSGGNSAGGIDEGIVRFEPTKNLSLREKVLIETATREIEDGRIIFGGDIFDMNGVKRCSAGEAISFRSLESSMNWLIKGVRIVGN